MFLLLNGLAVFLAALTLGVILLQQEKNKKIFLFSLRSTIFTDLQDMHSQLHYMEQYLSTATPYDRWIFVKEAYACFVKLKRDGFVFFASDRRDMRDKVFELHTILLYGIFNEDYMIIYRSKDYSSDIFPIVLDNIKFAKAQITKLCGDIEKYYLRLGRYPVLR